MLLWISMLTAFISSLRMKDVLEKLGKPIKVRKVKVDNCGEDTISRLNYPGLEIDLWSDDTGKVYIAVSFLVTSAKWDIGRGLGLARHLATW